MLQLLYILATNVPFKPNLSILAEKSNVHRNTINNYLHFLEQARLIKQLFPSGISIPALQKPEKIHLDNANLAHALSLESVNSCNKRETFFLNQLAQGHQVHYPKHGDFKVDNKWVFEIGGKDKSSKQIAGVANSFRVQDDLEFPVRDALPLWIFGFLY